MNEADTRAEFIDKQLEAAGWLTNAETGVRVRREYNINAGEIRSSGIRTGQLKADYILEYKNTKLAVVEAKSNELDVTEGVAQAKLYAQKLRFKRLCREWERFTKSTTPMALKEKLMLFLHQKSFGSVFMVGE